MANIKRYYTMVQTGELTAEDIAMFFPATKEEELKILKQYTIQEGGTAHEG